MKLLEYFFYKIYSLLGKSYFHSTINHFRAASFLFLWSLFNISTIAMVVELFIGHRINPSLSKGVVIMLLIIYYIPFYEYFLKKGRYIQIIKNYKNISDECRIKYNQLFWIYMIGSVIVFFSLVFLRIYIYNQLQIKTYQCKMKNEIV